MSNSETAHIPAGTSYLAVVGQILAQRRRDVGLQQSEVAGHMDLSQSAWSRIERGEAAISVDQLRRAASVLGVSGAQIIADADRAVMQLECRGIVVAPGRALPREASGLALVSAIALSALVLGALSR
jgi:transcriptional regulator with XRE-family HTH domain